MRPIYWIPVLAGVYGGYFSQPSSKSITSIIFLFFIAGPGIAAFSETYNEIYDRHIDNLSKGYTFGPFSLACGSGILKANLINLNTAYLISYLNLLISLFFSFFININVVLFTIFGIFLSIIYSNPKIRIKERPFGGQLLLGLGYGPIAFSIGLFANENYKFNYNLLIPLVVLFVGSLIIGITSELIDYEDNLANKINNIAIRLGFYKIRLMISSFGFVFILLIIFLNYFNLLQPRKNIYFVFIVAMLLRCLAILFINNESKYLIKLHTLSIMCESLLPFSLILK